VHLEPGGSQHVGEPQQTHSGLLLVGQPTDSVASMWHAEVMKFNARHIAVAAAGLVSAGIIGGVTALAMTAGGQQPQEGTIVQQVADESTAEPTPSPSPAVEPSPTPSPAASPTPTQTQTTQPPPPPPTENVPPGTVDDPKPSRVPGNGELPAPKPTLPQANTD